MSVDRSVIATHRPKVTADGLWREGFRVIGRPNKRMTLHIQNPTADTISVRAREANDQSTWVSIYGMTMDVVAGGTGTLDVYWTDENLIIDVQGSEDGQVLLEEVGHTNAFSEGLSK